MKKMCSLVLIMALFTVFFSPAFLAAGTKNDAIISTSPDTTVSSPTPLPSAKEPAPPKKWKVRTTARVLGGRDKKLVVSLLSPETLSPKGKVTVDALQYLPLDSTTKYYSASGEEIPNKLFTGQNISVSFDFYWDNSTPPRVVPVKLYDIKELEKTSSAKSYYKGDLKEDTFIASVLHKNKDQLTVYIELGRVFYEKTEYTVQGVYTVAVPKNATLTDTKGKTSSLDAVKPGSRIEFTAKDSHWQESYPPTYVPMSVAKLQLLASGEKVIPADQLTDIGYLTATVKTSGISSSGGVEILVIPEKDSREATLAASYRVQGDPLIENIYGKNGSLLKATDLKAGDVVEIYYSGLEYDETVGVIPWFHRIRVQ